MLVGHNDNNAIKVPENFGLIVNRRMCCGGLYVTAKKKNTIYNFGLSVVQRLRYDKI